MKQGIHPEYGPVVFRDRSAGFAFLTRSTLAGRTAAGPGRPAATIEWEDGNTYPVVDVDISSASHPFWTGNSRVVDTAGRVERFRQRYGRGGTSAKGRA
ncbi:type B 50S ribosomal protein L31 [Myceligenerans pegani]|uniref:Large ribosomal subunit protein bL31B n=1 Tax=Myceligenerans pegani TaxID=2776917 RepID=A0ABR9N2Z8_9MICO|nr:type B 50S ribosomal protein L31 [Myceligenerans sp. TRM 65318]MBE1877735.1 type B 50S ribosomal protein L31 [Myceligenerans sp. TRM 65318]MBE3020006.1 type B 50S ribosomal protein L31 [Myceligenerans sp. TRM 65318]